MASWVGSLTSMIPKSGQGEEQPTTAPSSSEVELSAKADSPKMDMAKENATTSGSSNTSVQANASGSSDSVLDDGANAKQFSSRLFVSNIPKTKGQTELMHVFAAITDGLKDVIVYKDGELDYTKNRGFCFLDYETTEKAQAAKANLLGMDTVMGCRISVDEADPQFEVDEETMKNVKVLYVKNLSPAVSETELNKLFSTYGQTSVKKIKNFAFINFDDRAKAEAAKHDLDRTWIGGTLIEIEWARPQIDKKQREKILRAREARQNKLRAAIAGDKKIGSTQSKSSEQHADLPFRNDNLIYYPNGNAASVRGGTSELTYQVPTTASSGPGAQSRGYNYNAGGMYQQGYGHGQQSYYGAGGGTSYYAQQNLGYGQGHGYGQGYGAGGNTAANYYTGFGHGHGQGGHSSQQQYGHGHGGQQLWTGQQRGY